MTHAEFELYRPTYTPKIKALLITPTVAIKEADFIISQQIEKKKTCSQLISVCGCPRQMLMKQWREGSYGSGGCPAGKTNQCVMKKRLFSPQKEMSPMSLSLCVDKYSQDKIKSIFLNTGYG